VENVSTKPQKPLPKEPPKKDGFYCVGVIFDAHGTSGDVKIKAFTENQLILNEHKNPVDENGKEFKIKKVRTGSRRGVVANLEGITNRNMAEELLGTYLYLANDTLPETSEGEYNYATLMSMNVELENGKAFGSITNIFSNGAQDILVINHVDGEEVLVPFVDEYVLSISESDKKLIVSEDASQFVGL
jgi:16S rRNA processing protein RimM